MAEREGMWGERKEGGSLGVWTISTLLGRKKEWTTFRSALVSSLSFSPAIMICVDREYANIPLSESATL